MPACCGCHLASDYGTSILTGDGSSVSPFEYSQVDPTFERPVARVIRATNQTIPNNAPTAISFSTVDFDSHTMFSLVNPTRLTATLPGFYLMGAGLHWAQTALQRETFFRMNGTLELDRQSQFNTTVQTHHYSLGYLWYFAPGDYVEVVTFQLSGGNLDLVAGAQNLNFWMTYLGRKNG